MTKTIANLPVGEALAGLPSSPNPQSPTVKRIDTADARIQIVDQSGPEVLSVKQVLEHYLRLSDKDVRMRFLRRMTEAELERHATHALSRAECVAVMHAQGCIRGVAELYRGRCPQNCSAEIAISVEAAFQGRGIGVALAASAINRARRSSIRRIEATFQRGNQAARCTLERLRFRVRCEGEECHASLDLVTSTLETIDALHYLHL
ncbi:GNAT family N-acetyltransferase [Stenotrophomonas maltophilia]|nr:GNAT family N-acetyltransferase [Stenotrophomonas maltophilia]